jgi:hypothetical protein
LSEDVSEDSQKMKGDKVLKDESQKMSENKQVID